MKFGRGLECIVHRHQKGRLANSGQNLPLGFSMLGGLSFLYNGGLFENLHCKELTSIDTSLLFGQKYFAIGSSTKNFEQFKIVHGHRARGRLLGGSVGCVGLHLAFVDC